MPNESFQQPRPETYETPERVPLFNVDDMSDAQIIVTNRALWMAADYGIQDGDSFDQMLTGDNLHIKLANDVRDLASRDPERVKNLITVCAYSGIEHDQELAAKSVRGLVGYDYGFTTDILLSMLTEPDGYRKFNDLAETARDEVRLMMRDNMTPEQIDAFNARYLRYGDDRDQPIQPAEPDGQ
jgi:hypothetical protein